MYRFVRASSTNPKQVLKQLDAECLRNAYSFQIVFLCAGLGYASCVWPSFVPLLQSENVLNLATANLYVHSWHLFWFRLEVGTLFRHPLRLFHPLHTGAELLLFGAPDLETKMLLCSNAFWGASILLLFLWKDFILWDDRFKGSLSFMIGLFQRHYMMYI